MMSTSDGDVLKNGNTTASVEKRKKHQISINDYFSKRRKMSQNIENSDQDSAADKSIDSSLTSTTPVKKSIFSFLDESEAEKRLSSLKESSILPNTVSSSSANNKADDVIKHDVIIPPHFIRTSACFVSLPSLQPTDDHTILFRPHLMANKPPRPYPENYRDYWDKDHVRMPCSPENMYPTLDKKIQKRWELIEGTLLQPFQTSKDLEEAILVYNHHYKDKWNFESWHSYCNIHLNEVEREDLFTNLLPAMVNLALQLPQIVTQSPKLLQRGCGHSLTLSQHQASCLLANAFFCTYPRRNSLKSSEYSTYPDINFSRMFRGVKDVLNQVKTEKLKTVLNYFQRIIKDQPCGTITYTRKVLSESDIPSWEHSTREFCDLFVTEDGTIEDDGKDLLQVDFANRMIGGGVVGEGCVQEEIRFLICPELILARLFTEKLEPNESLLITGVERFSSYAGYAQTFSFKGNFNDYTPSDRWGRRNTQVIAIDAHVFRCYGDQFKTASLKREAEKALCGFFEKPNSYDNQFSAIATGNWGCGAFGGDVYLKTLIQLMAASIAERDLAYFTFGDKQLRDDIEDMHEFLRNEKITIGQLWNMLIKYGKEISSKHHHIELFPFLKETFKNYTCDTDTESVDGETGNYGPDENNVLEIRGVPCEIPGDMEPPSPDYIADTP